MSTSTTDTTSYKQQQSTFSLTDQTTSQEIVNHLNLPTNDANIVISKNITGRALLNPRVTLELLTGTKKTERSESQEMSNEKKKLKTEEDYLFAMKEQQETIKYYQNLITGYQQENSNYFVEPSKGLEHLHLTSVNSQYPLLNPIPSPGLYHCTSGQNANIIKELKFLKSNHSKDNYYDRILVEKDFPDIIWFVGSAFTNFGDNLPTVTQYPTNPSEEFSQRLLLKDLKGQPLIFTKVMKDWPALEKWSTEYILKQFGDTQVDVDMCTFGPMKEIQKMKFSEYLKRSKEDSWKNNNNVASSDNPVIFSKKPYLRNCPLLENEQLRSDIKSNTFFSEEDHNLIIMGAFIGAKDTATKMHKDTGNNLVAMITGSKYIVLLPPNEESNFQNVDDINILNPTSSSGHTGLPIESHPSFKNVGRAISTVLKPGELLFLPIGWLHYIHNLDFSISVSCWGKSIEN
eukprot:gene4774-5954_t